MRVWRRLGDCKPAIDAMLCADPDAPRKQQHTARRVRAQLVDEHSAGKVSYLTVRDYVTRRPQIAFDAGEQLAAGSSRRPTPPGAEAEVEADYADL